MSYIRLLVMSVVSFILMFVFMYVMVDRFDNVYMNYNQLYMAAGMTFLMILIELGLMGSMYRGKKFSKALMVISFVGLMVSVLFIRNQMAIDDKEFLQSMIPHHAAALLMSKKAKINDPEVLKLRDAIISAQVAEIEVMKTKLAAFERAKIPNLR